MSQGTSPSLETGSLLSASWALSSSSRYPRGQSRILFRASFFRRRQLHLNDPLFIARGPPEVDGLNANKLNHKDTGTRFTRAYKRFNKMSENSLILAEKHSIVPRFLQYSISPRSPAGKQTNDIVHK